ncbi:MAG TPA: PadR family transcriptional regulator [Gemmatimonadaceae bacterium]|jgi:DNA-binding PadR family transcriptional regulator
MPRPALGEFEQVVLLAILRLGDTAYAPAILDEILECTGSEASPGSMYVTLDRLEAKGLIRSRLADATAQRSGRARRYVSVTAHGVRQLRATRASLLALWRGLEGILEPC